MSAFSLGLACRSFINKSLSIYVPFHQTAPTAATSVKAVAEVGTALVEDAVGAALDESPGPSLFPAASAMLTDARASTLTIVALSVFS